MTRSNGNREPKLKAPTLSHIEIDNLAASLRNLQVGDRLRITIDAKVGRIHPKLDQVLIEEEEVRVSRLKP